MRNSKHALASLTALLFLVSACGGSTGLSGSSASKDKDQKKETAAKVDEPEDEEIVKADVPAKTTGSPSAADPVKEPGSGSTAAVVPERTFTEESLAVDTNTKWLAYKAYLALADADPRTTEQDGFLFVIADTAVYADLSEEIAVKTVELYPMFALSDPASFPSLESAKASADAILRDLIESPKMQGAGLGLLAPAGKSQKASFAELEAKFAANKAKADEDRKLKAEADGKLAELKAATDAQLAKQAALKQQLADVAATAAAAKKATPDPAVIDAGQRLYMGSNGIGWLLTISEAELATGFSGTSAMGRAPQCTHPNAMPMFRTVFIHPDAGWVYDISPEPEAQQRAANEPGWKMEGQVFCVFRDAQPGTVPLVRYCNQQRGGRVYYAGAGGPPNDAPVLTWLACGSHGYIYP